MKRLRGLSYFNKIIKSTKDLVLFPPQKSPSLRLPNVNHLHLQTKATVVMRLPPRGLCC